MASKQRRRTRDVDADASVVGESGEAGAETEAKTEAKAETKAGSGRTTPKGTPSRTGSRVGRPKTAQESGRYTPPIPRSVRKSSRVFGVSIIGLLVLGVLMVLLNYLNVLPGATSVWYLLGGLGIIFVGSMMATKYH